MTPGSEPKIKIISLKLPPTDLLHRRDKHEHQFHGRIIQVPDIVRGERNENMANGHRTSRMPLAGFGEADSIHCALDAGKP
jgi:hypothetical protein